MRIAFALAALLLLSACSFLGGSSPKTHYYTLNEIRTSGVATPHLTTPIKVAAVHLPGSLDRQEMVLSTSGNSVNISGVDRWSAPLGEMTRRVLSEDLAALLPQDMVIMPKTPAPADVRQIVITLSHFGPQSDGKVGLNAEWSLVNGANGKPTLRRDVHLTENPSGTNGQAVAYAMSQLVARLAGQIANAVAAH